LKSYELYQLIEVFDQMMKDERFTKQARINMGQEFINSMPPASLVKSAAQTYMVVRNYMAAVLQGAVQNGQTESAPKPEVKTPSSGTPDKASMDGKEHAHASDKTDETGGRRKVGKTSGAPSNSRRKKS
jgi:hypothetical protein